MQRTSGDKVTVGKRAKLYATGFSLVGWVFSKECVLYSVLVVVVSKTVLSRAQNLT